MAKDVIELKGLTKRFGTARGIEQVDLNVRSGAVFGFLGPNGAGKSTTINILLDFLRPTSGSAKIFGLDIQYDAEEIHRRIGFLTGDMALDNQLTGWQQLTYYGHLRGGLDKKYINALAKRLNCNLDRKFKTLSRGNKQKVGLVAALMHRPELLILDEPTSGLDPLMQAEFNKIILEHKQSGGTTFISSHVLSEIQEICDEVAFIREGRVVASRPVADITKAAPKDIVVTTKSKDLRTKLQKLAGIIISESSGDTIRGTFLGDVNALVRLVSGYRVEQFLLAEADLETIFMKYYESGEEKERV